MEGAFSTAVVFGAGLFGARAATRERTTMMGVHCWDMLDAHDTHGKTWSIQTHLYNRFWIQVRIQLLGLDKAFEIRRDHFLHIIYHTLAGWCAAYSISLWRVIVAEHWLPSWRPLSFWFLPLASCDPTASVAPRVRPSPSLQNTHYDHNNNNDDDQHRIRR